MDLDALRTQWAEQDARLEAGLHLNRRLLAAHYLDRAQSALERHARGLALEAALTLAVIAGLGAFLYSQLAQPRFLVPAMALDVLAVAIFVDLVRQITTARSIDCGEPVASFQKRLERVRAMRVRHVQGVLLVATLAWMPLLIVSMKVLFGIDAWRAFHPAWLAANVLLGVAVIPIAILLSRRFAGRMQGSPWIQQLMNDIAGHHLSAARAFLAEISEFEGEVRPVAVVPGPEPGQPQGRSRGSGR